MSDPIASAGIAERITNYLTVGGLFNPESMEHDKVRELLIDCRDALTTAAPPVEDVEAQSRMQSLRYAAEIDWWHRNWHRDTGIPCDGTMEVCRRAETCRTKEMPGLVENDARVQQKERERAAAVMCDYCAHPDWFVEGDWRWRARPAIQRLRGEWWHAVEDRHGTVTDAKCKASAIFTLAASESVPASFNKKGNSK